MRNLLSVYFVNLYMFRAYLGSSSGGTTIRLYLLMMGLCFPGWIGCSNPTRTTDSHLKRIISTNCSIHTVVPPDEWPRYARNVQRLMKFSENKLCIKLVFYLHEIWYRVSNRSLQISQSYARKNTVHTSIFFFLVSEFVLVQHLVTNPGINKVEIICDLFVVFLLNLLARWRFCCVAQTRRRVSYCGETFNEAAGQNLRSVCVLFELRSAF